MVVEIRGLREKDREAGRQRATVGRQEEQKGPDEGPARDTLAAY